MLTAHESGRAPVIADRYSLSPAVGLFVADDGSGRLIDMDGAFYALSGTATEMLQGALTDGVDETSAWLAGRYGVGLERIQGDVDALLLRLSRQGLIETAGVRFRRGYVRRLLARAVTGPVLGLLGLFGASEQRTVVILLLFARACTATFGWGPTVEAWRAAIRPKAARPAPDDVIERIDDTIRQTAAKLPSIDCKERALSCWYLLCCLGIPASLVVGIELFPLAGHCWCQVGDQVLTDSARRCEAFVPVMRYDGDPVASSHSWVQQWQQAAHR
jgi:hypothetical protein